MAERKKRGVHRMEGGLTDGGGEVFWYQAHWRSWSLRAASSCQTSHSASESGRRGAGERGRGGALGEPMRVSDRSSDISRRSWSLKRSYPADRTC